MKTSLVIMAAGIGSRFGGGIKQLEPVGMHGAVSYTHLDVYKRQGRTGAEYREESGTGIWSTGAAGQL